MKYREFIYITVFIYHEHKGSRILRNVGTLAPDSTVSHHSLGFSPKKCNTVNCDILMEWY